MGRGAAGSRLAAVALSRGASAPTKGDQGPCRWGGRPSAREALHQPPAVAAPGAQGPDRTALSAAAWAHPGLALPRTDALLLVQESGFWPGDFTQHHPSIPALASLLRTEGREEPSFLPLFIASSCLLRNRSSRDQTRFPWSSY